MKLKLACKLGKQMGMITIGEAVDNIEHHAISLFKYEDIVNELDALKNCRAQGFKINTMLFHNPRHMSGKPLLSTHQMGWL